MRKQDWGCLAQLKSFLDHRPLGSRTNRRPVQWGYSRGGGEVQWVGVRW